MNEEDNSEDGTGRNIPEVDGAEVVSEGPDSQPVLDRRRMFRKLVALGAGLGITGALLGLKDVPKARAYALELGADETYNDAGSSRTGMQSTTGDPRGTLYVKNNAVGTTQSAIQAYTTGGGKGVIAGAGASGIGLLAWGASPSAKPIVAQGAVGGQTANLQEWQNEYGAALSAVDSSGYMTVGHGAYGTRTDGGILIQGTGTSNNVSDVGLRIKNTTAQGNEWYIDSTGSDGTHTSGYGAGKLAFVAGLGGTPTMTLTPDSVGVGTTYPDRQLHIVGSNATVRIDRNVDSSQFLLVRTSGDFSQAWKTFVFGVKATGVDTGSFFIGDMHTNVSGSSDNRLLIDTTGRVGIGTTTPTEKLHVAGNVKATGFITGDVTFANGVRATEEGKGLAFLNDLGEKIAVLDREGNWHIKGKVMEDL